MKLKYYVLGICSLMIFGSTMIPSVGSADEIDELFDALTSESAGFGFGPTDTPQLVAKTADTISIRFPVALDKQKQPIKKYEVMIDSGGLLNITIDTPSHMFTEMIATNGMVQVTLSGLKTMTTNYTFMVIPYQGNDAMPGDASQMLTVTKETPLTTTTPPPSLPGGSLNNSAPTSTIHNAAAKPAIVLGTETWIGNQVRVPRTAGPGAQGTMYVFVNYADEPITSRSPVGSIDISAGNFSFTPSKQNTFTLLFSSTPTTPTSAADGISLTVKRYSANNNPVNPTNPNNPVIYPPKVGPAQTMGTIFLLTLLSLGTIKLIKRRRSY